MKIVRYILACTVIVFCIGCGLDLPPGPVARPEGSPLAPIGFSLQSGFYTGEQTLNLTCSESDSIIYYSTDGSKVSLESFDIVYREFDDSEPPNETPVTITNTQALIFTVPITITSTTLIRAQAFKGTVPVSEETNSIYFIDETTTLPVFSIVMNPYHLWDEHTGIYVQGSMDGSNPVIQPYGQENYNQDWERPGVIDFFEADNSHVFSIGGGIKIFGGWSRQFAQKSLALYARINYGISRIPYDFFGLADNNGLAITEYQSIVLRNSGDDWYRTMFRDAFLQSLCNNLDVDKQAYRPALLYLNGAYWGIHNIREKVNEAYLAAHYDYVNPHNVDILYSYDSQVVEGDNTNFKALLEFTENKVMATATNYSALEDWIDIGNFIDYTAAQLYFNNLDWPWSNIKSWRPRTKEGKWRWIIYDTDGSFGGKDWLDPIDPNLPAYDTITYLLSGESDSDFRTLFINLLDNISFRTNFIRRFRYLLQNDFSTATVTARLNDMEAVIAPAIVRHNTRWPDSCNNWSTAVQVMREFADTRDEEMLAHLAGFETIYGSNYIRNGGFNGGAFWNEGWTGNGAVFTFNNFAGDEAGGTVTTAGTDWGDIVVLYQDDLPLMRNKFYLLTFDGRVAGGTGTIGVALVNEDPWEIYSETTGPEDFKEITLTTSMTRQSMTCTMPVNNDHVRLVFTAGRTETGTEFYIDNVELAEE